MRIGLTGVPGTGKTTIAQALAERGFRVVHLNELARDAGLLHERDAQRANAYLVDLDALNEHYLQALGDAEGTSLAEGHFAHELDVDRVILLRTRPRVLEARLRARGWPEEKVRENVEAEALDVLAAEVLDTGAPAIEVDTTGLEPPAAADLVERALRTGEGPEIGTVSWDLGELDWA